MIGFRVTVNGEVLATAGIGGRHVLSAIVNSIETARPTGDVRKEIWMHLGGLVSTERAEDRKHVDWFPDGRKALAVGDEVLIEIIEIETPDQPLSEKPAGP
jgi:hypothetical protein